MDIGLLINISLICISICLISCLWYGYLVSRRNANLVEALGRSNKTNSELNSPAGKTISLDSDNFSQSSLDAINQSLETKTIQNTFEFWQQKYFRAGYFRKAERDRFKTYRFISLIIFSLLFSYLGFIVGSPYTGFFIIFGVLFGWNLPVIVLDRIIQKRDYEILYYLPLEIEQICIGVSSSLDIGPCIKGIVSMADERDCENPVTELFRYVQHYVKAGASLDEALTEVGRLSCHTELKHAFMALSQVSRHGGEISKQLQQLANSVSQQRETKIDAKIRKLELEATGPVALVFLAFMGILLIGLGAQIMTIFK